VLWLKRLIKTWPVPLLHDLLSCFSIHRLCAAALTLKATRSPVLVPRTQPLCRFTNKHHQLRSTPHSQNGEDRHLPSFRHLPALRGSDSASHNHNLRASYWGHCDPEGDAHQQDRYSQLLSHIRNVWPLRSRCSSHPVSFFDRGMMNAHS
jgi:hypothetical protein